MKSIVLNNIEEVSGNSICQESPGKHPGKVYLLVMSPSQNFPARAEPSYESSEPSRAELGHFNIRAETELTLHTDNMYVKK